jgi:hypothetical protein
VSESIQLDIEVPTPKPASSPSDVTATAPQAVASSGALVAFPSAAERPGHLILVPKQTRGGDVRNAPYGPVPAVNHLTNVHHPVFVPAPDGDAA